MLGWVDESRLLNPWQRQTPETNHAKPPDPSGVLQTHRVPLPKRPRLAALEHRPLLLHAALEPVDVQAAHAQVVADRAEQQAVLGGLEVNEVAALVAAGDQDAAGLDLVKHHLLGLGDWGLGGWAGCDACGFRGFRVCK